MIDYIVSLAFLMPMVYQDLKLRVVHEKYLFGLYIVSIMVGTHLFGSTIVLLAGTGLFVFIVHRKLDPFENVLGSADIILIMCMINIFSGGILGILGLSILVAYFYIAITQKEDVPFFACVLCGIIMHWIVLNVILPRTIITI